MTKPIHRLPVLLIVVLLAGCAAILPGGDAPDAAPASDNAAVLALLDQANTDTAAGRLQSATATVERALRIEPRNPRLWLELARLRLALGEPEQAEGLVARALSYAGSDRRLRAACWRMIAETRMARGDTGGASAAQARVREFER